jgi:hypothetical protein
MKKDFNTYKEGLDLEVLRQYCMEHGEARTFLRGETLEDVGELAQWVAFVERGCFKYMVHNDEEGKDYCTGFAFEGKFVKGELKAARRQTDVAIADLYRTIIAMMDLMPSDALTALYTQLKGFERYAREYYLPKGKADDDPDEN